MLEFVWHLRGSVPLDGVSSDALALDHVEQLLAKQQKSVSERGSDYLAFDDPLWRNPFGPNWLAMVIYDRGRFWIERDLHERRLRYDLRSLHGMVFCLFAAFTAFFFGLANDGVSGGLKFAAGAFAWLYGMNILLALFRVPSGIRNELLPV
ncbi:hypothetical protein [Sphingosinicella rhizophila]|uniref:Uncharacterized protein n=1 Tax=Sphingosinicella rhizophila TaxID=3050082 RepID=A0ABU3QCH6_9SPHN|nr:hypothetical protein [Sphingosinicella sp. GR2756]MDT9601095.1 hypothetical protein [Sphingosinicella sp. GR2756]